MSPLHVSSVPPPTGTTCPRVIVRVKAAVRHLCPGFSAPGRVSCCSEDSFGSLLVFFRHFPQTSNIEPTPLICFPRSAISFQAASCSATSISARWTSKTLTAKTNYSLCQLERPSDSLKCRQHSPGLFLLTTDAISTVLLFLQALIYVSCSGANRR